LKKSNKDCKALNESYKKHCEECSDDAIPYSYYNQLSLRGA